MQCLACKRCSEVVGVVVAEKNCGISEENLLQMCLSPKFLKRVTSVVHNNSSSSSGELPIGDLENLL